MTLLKYKKKSEHCGILTIDRPETLNALSTTLLEEMREFFEHGIKKEDPTIKVLIVKGEGKTFISGADIKEMAAMRHPAILDFLELGQGVTHLLETAHFITLAAVNGYALGGGLEMALACDFIYASKEAKLGLPEVTLGMIPGFGGTQRLARAVGTRKAKEMILTGATITAEEGYQLGIVNQVCEPQDLMERCLEVANKMGAHSAMALQQGKNAVNFGYQLGIHEALEIERNMFVVCFATTEREQAMRKFLKQENTGA